MNEPTGLVRLKQHPNYGRTPDGKFYQHVRNKWLLMRPHVKSADGDHTYRFRTGGRVPSGTSYRKVSEVS